MYLAIVGINRGAALPNIIVYYMLMDYKKTATLFGHQFANLICILKEQVQRKKPAPLNDCSGTHIHQDKPADTSLKHRDMSHPKNA